jgi:uncharacterized membrane protein
MEALIFDLECSMVENFEKSPLVRESGMGTAGGNGNPTGGPAMNKGGHLWALGFDDIERAEQVRTAIGRLGESRCLTLLDTAVVVRYPDGCVTLDGEPFVVAAGLSGRTIASFLAGLALGAPPLTGAAVGVWVGRNAGDAAEFAIDDEFIRAVEALMKPESSALFVLDREGDMAAILQGIRGLGGTILKTNVDLQRAKLIQSTLAATAAEPSSENQP